MKKTYIVDVGENTELLSIVGIEKRAVDRYKFNEISKDGVSMLRIEKTIGKYAIKENEIAYSVTELPFILGGTTFHINVYGKVIERGHDGGKKVLKVEPIGDGELRRRIETFLKREYIDAYVNFLR